MIKAVHFSREGDRKVIDDYIQRFSKYSEQELVDEYNQEARTGIVGVHRQHVYLISLREVLRERFKHSPIFYESKVIGMQGEVKLADGKVWFK